jgi:hypothetical protein
MDRPYNYTNVCTILFIRLYKSIVSCPYDYMELFCMIVRNYYPPLLGITRRSCLEARRSKTWSTESRIDFSMALEGPPFLHFSASILSVAAASITIGLVLCQRWLLLHEVMSPGTMVCVTLIIKTFEYVHLFPFISNKCLDLTLAHLTMSGGLTRCPSKPVPVGFGLPLRGASEKPSSAPIITPLFHLGSCPSIPYTCPGNGLTYLQDCTLPHGKKGLKAQKVKES